MTYSNIHNKYKVSVQLAIIFATSVVLQNLRTSKQGEDTFLITQLEFLYL